MKKLNYILALIFVILLAPVIMLGAVGGTIFAGLAIGFSSAGKFFDAWYRSL